MLEDVGDSDEPIPLPNVVGKVLAKVVEYCEYHKDDEPALVDDDKDAFDNSRNRSGTTMPCSHDHYIYPCINIDSRRYFRVGWKLYQGGKRGAL